jgi:hypothetical protein
MTRAGKKRRSHESTKRPGATEVASHPQAGTWQHGDVIAGGGLLQGRTARLCAGLCNAMQDWQEAGQEIGERAVKY